MALTSTIGGDGQLFIGEDKAIKLELLDSANLPVDMATWVILFDVRKTDTSSTALFSKTPASIQGVYNATRALNTQRAVITLSSAEMDTIKAGTYRYSWKRTDAGVETVLAWGDFTPQKATAP